MNTGDPRINLAPHIDAGCQSTVVTKSCSTHLVDLNEQFRIRHTPTPMSLS